MNKNVFKFPTQPRIVAIPKSLQVKQRHLRFLTAKIKDYTEKLQSTELELSQAQTAYDNELTKYAAIIGTENIPVDFFKYKQ